MTEKSCLFEVSFIEAPRDDLPAYHSGTRVERDGRIVVFSSPLGSDVTDGRGVTLSGDIRHMAAVADRWHLDFGDRRPWPQPSTPFVDAHVAFASLRNQKRADIDTLARWVVSVQKQVPVSEEEAHQRLAGWLTVAIGSLLARLGEAPITAEEAASLTEDIPTADAHLATYIGELGKGTAKTVARVRADGARRAQKPTTLWDAWLIDQPLVDTEASAAKPATWALRVLALAGWDHVVRPELEHEQRNPPSLTRAMHAPVTELLGRKPTREVDLATGQVSLRLSSDLTVSAVHTDAIAAPFLDRGIELFKSINAHKVIRHLVFEGHRQLFAGNTRPDLLVYPRGYGALAEAIGIKGGKGADEVRALIEAMHCMDVPIAGTTTRLVNRAFTEARRGQSAHLTVQLGLPLLPHYGRTIEGDTVDARRARDLIPLLPLPPIHGRPNEAGAQATLSMRVVRHLRDHATELAKHGHAPMPFETFVQMGRDSGLPPQQARAVLLLWTGRPLPDKPALPLEQQMAREHDAFLKEPVPGRFTLGDLHTAERAFLVEGGRRSLDGAEAARRQGLKRDTIRSRIRSGPKG